MKGFNGRYLEFNTLFNVCGTYGTLKIILLRCALFKPSTFVIPLSYESSYFLGYIWLVYWFKGACQQVQARVHYELLVQVIHIFKSQ